MRRIAAAAGFWLALGLAPAARAAGDELITLYSVRPGDTLEGLARRYMSGPADALMVERLNAVRDPYRMPIGSTLRIPTRLLRSAPATMSVASVSGPVSRSAAGRAGPLARGDLVREGDRIATGADAFVTLLQPDGSRLTLPSHTTVTLRLLRRLVLGEAVQSVFTVEEGRGEMQVTPLRGAADRFEIRTPAAVAAVRGTGFRVAYDAARALSTLEVVEGRVAESPPSGEDALPIDAGQAAQRPLGGERRIIPLPAAPALEPAGRTPAGLALYMKIADPRAGFRYHVLIARDDAFADPVAETTTAAEARFETLPPGVLYARITAVDETGVEGLARVYTVERLAAPR